MNPYVLDPMLRLLWVKVCSSHYASLLPPVIFIPGFTVCWAMR